MVVLDRKLFKHKISSSDLLKLWTHTYGLLVAYIFTVHCKTDYDIKVKIDCKHFDMYVSIEFLYNFTWIYVPIDVHAY